MTYNNIVVLEKIYEFIVVYFFYLKSFKFYLMINNFEINNFMTFSNGIEWRNDQTKVRPCLVPKISGKRDCSTFVCI